MTTININQKILILNTYIPPYRVLGSLKEVSSIVKKLQKKYPSTLMLIIGGFNLLKTKWITDNETSLLIPDIKTTRQIELSFLEEINKWGLQQINNTPNSQGSFLDLIFTNDISQTTISETLPIDWIDKASHNHNLYSLTIVTDNTKNIKGKEAVKRNYNKMNMKHVRNVIDKTTIFNYSDDEAMFEEHNDRTGILLRINSYIEFITNCENRNSPLIKKSQEHRSSMGIIKRISKLKSLSEKAIQKL